MKNSILIIALLLLGTCTLYGQNKIDTVKKPTVINEWTVIKKETKDKTIGKNKDGKIIYEGPRGGKYYISAKGRKVYIKKN